MISAEQIMALCAFAGLLAGGLALFVHLTVRAAFADFWLDLQPRLDRLDRRVLLIEAKLEMQVTL